MWGPALCAPDWLSDLGKALHLLATVTWHGEHSSVLWPPGCYKTAPTLSAGTMVRTELWTLSRGWPQGPPRQASLFLPTPQWGFLLGAGQLPSQGWDLRLPSRALPSCLGPADCPTSWLLSWGLSLCELLCRYIPPFGMLQTASRKQTDTPHLP